jgi:hypothetical protein
MRDVVNNPCRGRDLAARYEGKLRPSPKKEVFTTLPWISQTAPRFAATASELQIPRLRYAPLGMTERRGLRLASIPRWPQLSRNSPRLRSGCEKGEGRGSLASPAGRSFEEIPPAPFGMTEREGRGSLSAGRSFQGIPRPFPFCHPERSVA